jgi:hypothetical protein
MSDTKSSEQELRKQLDAAVAKVRELEAKLLDERPFTCPVCKEEVRKAQVKVLERVYAALDPNDHNSRDIVARAIADIERGEDTIDKQPANVKD